MQIWNYSFLFAEDVIAKQRQIEERIGFTGSWELAFEETIKIMGVKGWELVQIFDSTLPVTDSGGPCDKIIAVFKQKGES